MAKSYYAEEAVTKLIDTAINDGGQYHVFEEGNKLKYGLVVIHHEGYKPVVAKEVITSYGNSAYDIKTYNEMPKKYAKAFGIKVVKLHKYVAEASDEKSDYIIDVKAESLEIARKSLEEDGYTVQKIALEKDIHFCKYCGGIVEGKFEDLLCDDCRETFGHALYSEL